MRVVDTNSETVYFTEYKVVELSSVTDADIERVLNEWSLKGWNLDGIQFAMRDSSKRPSMAFVLFTRSAKTKEGLHEIGTADDDDDLDDEPA